MSWFRDPGGKQHAYTCLHCGSLTANELFCDTRLLLLPPPSVDQTLQRVSRPSALDEYFWDVPFLELSSYGVPCISRVHTVTIGLTSLYCVGKSNKLAFIINICIQSIGFVPLENLVNANLGTRNGVLPLSQGRSLGFSLIVFRV